MTDQAAGHEVLTTSGQEIETPVGKSTTGKQLLTEEDRDDYEREMIH